MLLQKRSALESLKNILIEKEIIDGKEVYEIVCSLESDGFCIMP
jgi:ATP-dependent Zn protease